MVQTFFERSCTIDRLRRGPLAGHIDLFAARLATDGYSRLHSRSQLRLVGQFNRWLDQNSLTAEQLDEDAIERYRRYLKRRKRVRSEDVCTLFRLLDLLREQGVTPRRTIEAVPTAREILLEKYRHYLSEERGLSDRVLQDIPGVYRKGCAPARPDPRPAMCFFGEVTQPQSTVVLFGDSHAAEWFPALLEIADVQHWRLATIVKPGCTPLNMRVDPQMYLVCEEWRRAAIGEIEALRPDLVIVTSASRAVDADGKFLADMQVWEQAARDTFAALARQGVKVRFIRDTPFANYDVPGCLAQAEWDGRTQCPAPVSTVALSPDVYAAEERAAQGLGNVKFLDLSDRMCGPDRCYLEVGGQVIYRDGDHLTASFSRTLGAVLFQRLRDSEQ
jgi:SGNH domain (fused to AT3 domains)